MKIGYLWSILLFIIYSSCSHSTKKDKDIIVKQKTVSVKKSKISTSIPISKNIVFVTDTDAADIYKLPDSTSDVNSYTHYGQAFAINRDLKNGWLEIIDYNNNDTLGFIRRSSVGSEKDIRLTAGELSEVYPGTADEVTTPYPNIELSFITKDQFDAMKHTVKDLFVADTNIIKKHKGVTILPTKKGSIKYKDDDKGEVSYLGQYPILDKYLIAESWYEAESTDYYFIDKITGIKSDGISSLPYLSFDKQTIMCIWQPDADDTYTEPDVFKIKDGLIRSYAKGVFKKWVPALYGDQFWGNDNYYYIAVIPSVVYSGHYNLGLAISKHLPEHDLRYIKIRIKGPSTKEVLQN